MGFASGEWVGGCVDSRLSPGAVVKCDTAMTKPNFKNRTLWTGDNLDIMRGLNSETVDLIYLDPPFNSNRDYAAPIGSEAAGAAFKDTWTLSDVDLEWHGEIAEANPSLYRVIDAAREAHGKAMQSYLIMMAVRLLEMKRLLKSTGSVYLHCDPTASHYLKLLMDAVFGESNFRNEIVWRRSHPKGLAFTRFAQNHDLILVYGRHGATTWNQMYVSNPNALKQYNLVEPGSERRYQLTSLLNPNPNRPNLTYEFKGVTKVWRWTRERMEQADRDGLIVVPRGGKGVPRLKRYLDEQEGIPISDTWDDVSVALGKERTGYPTQKPLSLLERIINASSNEGQVVLDPFCGCATALIAAEKLGRQWIGIDLSSVAKTLVQRRMAKELGFDSLGVVYRGDVPMRTDLGKLPSYKTHKHTLFGKQEGHCAGCRHDFPFRNFTVDHVVSQSKGGTDHIDNLQLLCNACNSMKGTKTQEEFLVTLKQAGIG